MHLWSPASFFDFAQDEAYSRENSLRRSAQLVWAVHLAHVPNRTAEIRRLPSGAVASLDGPHGQAVGSAVTLAAHPGEGRDLLLYVPEPADSDRGSSPGCAALREGDMDTPYIVIPAGAKRRAGT